MTVMASRQTSSFLSVCYMDSPDCFHCRRIGLGAPIRRRQGAYAQRWAGERTNNKGIPLLRPAYRI